MEKKAIKIELFLDISSTLWIMYNNEPYKFEVKEIAFRICTDSKIKRIVYKCSSNKYGKQIYINLWEIENCIYTEESNINSRIEIFETKEELVNSLLNK